MWKTHRPGAAGSLMSKRLARLLCTLAAVMGIAASGATTRAFSQDQPPASKTAPMSGDVADGNPSTPDDGTSGSSRAGGSESLLGGIRNAPGSVIVVTLVIAAMSFYLIALVVWMALNYRTSATAPAELLRDVQDLLDQTKYNEAYHRLVGDSSFLARVLAAGVRKLPAGLAQAQRAAELANESTTMEMEHRTTYLATVGTLGPMIGLVGTVYGMIIAFRVVIAVEGPHAAGKPACLRDLHRPLRDARGNRDLDSGHLLLCVVSQPDRTAIARSRNDGRAVA